MMKRILLVLVTCLALSATYEAAAQVFDTPVADLIRNYKEERGVKKFLADGGKLNIARGFLKRYPVAPLAPDVTELCVLRFQGAPVDLQLAFEKELREILKQYQYVGMEDGPQGECEVYVLMTSVDEVEEMIVYNAAIYSLTTLHGPFSSESLLKLSTKNKKTVVN